MSSMLAAFLPLEYLDLGILDADKAVVDSCMARLEKSSRNVCLSGGHPMLLSGLLFQAAVTYSAQGKKVLIIRPRPMIDLPFPVHGMIKPDYKALQMLDFMYLSTLDQFVDFLLSVSESPKILPRVLMVDGLDFYMQAFKDTSSMAISKISALLLTTVHCLQRRLGSVVPLMVSVNDSLEHHCKLYREFLGNVFILKECESDEFELQELQAHSDCLLSFSLSLRKSHISLNRFTITSSSTDTETICEEPVKR